MTPLDKKQKRLFLGILGAAALTAILLLIPLLAPDKAPASRESLVAVIPEADLEEGEATKTGSYRRGGISDYWDSLGETERREETAARETEEEPAPLERGKPRAVGVEELFGDVRETPAAEPQRKKGGTGKAAPANRPSPPGLSQVSPAPSEPAPTQEAPLEEPPRPQVKRSGAVSSLDEDLSSDLGNGFSTLDGTDRWVEAGSGKPYRCMFTRDEKVKSGQRITVRLLEDLVIDGVHVPRNTHLQGVVTVSDRMEVRVNTLDMGGRILSFHFEAYDTDGGKGIYCSDLSKTGKTVLEQGISTLSSTLGSGLGRVARDAAAVGASIVRNKAGEATVSVPAGYTFYIIEQTN